MAVSNVVSLKELNGSAAIEARITDVEKIASYSWIGYLKPIIVPGSC